jgi:TP901 family phage tail tape measure protein
MANRTLTVALRAVVAGYTGPMRAAATSTGPLEASLMRVQRAGAGLSRVGSTLTSRVSLPIVAVGAVATKMALDFDKSFSRMQGLAGVAGDEIDGLKDKVLDLAGETGKAPVELADALYTLRSSGLDAGGAMEALEASAKASAAGLGDTAVVADAVSSAMNAYAASGMTAARATDVLVATAREGKAEPAELAAQMGRVLPVAAQLGVSFEDVGAAIATLSLSGNDAATSTTQLTNVMSKLLKPSMQGAKALEAVGLSVEQVQQMLAQKGLLGTLEELRARLGESGFVRFLEDQQAVQGGLALLGGDLEATRDRFGALADSAGASADAFAKTDSDSRKLSQAWAQVQVAMIKFGSIIAPVAADLATLASVALDAFGSIPEPVQKVIVLFAGLVAAMFPLLYIGGKLASGFATVMTTLQQLAVPAGTVSGAFHKGTTAAGGLSGALGRLPAAARVAAAGLGALGVALTALELLTARNEANARNWVEDLVGDVDVAKLDEVRDALADARAELDRLDDREGKGRVFSVFGANVFATSGDRERADRIDALRAKIEELEGSEASLEGQERQLAGAYVGSDEAVAGLAESTTAAVNALSEYADQVQASLDPLFGMVDALGDNRAAQAEVAAAQQAVNEARASGDPTALAEAEQRLADAHRAAAGTALDVTGATARLAAGIEAGTVSVDEAKRQLDAWVDQGLISRDTANAMAYSFGIAAGKADQLAGDYRVNVRGQEDVRAMVDRINDKMATLHDKTLTIRTHFVSTGQGGSGGIPLEARAEGGPVGAGRLYEVAERGRAELLRMGSHTYLIPGSDGHVMPAMRSYGGPGGGGGGATTVNYNLTFNGPTNDQQVIEAIKRHERRNGSGWRR